MASLFNPRTWPHPERGNYLGANKRCDSHNEARNTAGLRCKKPVDALDRVGVWHDSAVKKDGHPAADLIYAWKMLTINPFNPDNYASVPVEFLDIDFPIDGRFYQYGSAVVMGAVGLVTTPLRLLRKIIK